jgi:hypothetical protein
VVSDPSRVCLIDTESGDGGLCYDASEFTREAPRGPIEIIGWEGAWPWVNTSQAVVSLQGVHGKLVYSPQTLAFLGFASERVRWSQRMPRGRDPGPFYARFSLPINVAGGIVLVVLFTAAIWTTRRIRPRN